MGNQCCGGNTKQPVQEGSAVQLSTNQTIYANKELSAPERANSFLLDLGSYTIEVAFQRAQGRRDHQEDYISLCSLRSYGKTHNRHDIMFGEPGPFYYTPMKEAIESADDPDTLWFAVFDGHGGPRVSHHCAENMQNMFLAEYAKLNAEEKEDNVKVEEILKNIFLEFDEEIKMLPPHVETIQTGPNCLGQGSTISITRKASTQGSTGTVITMTKLHEEDAILTFSNSGDSRLIAFTVENFPSQVPLDEMDENIKKSSMFNVTTKLRSIVGSEPASSVFGSYFNNSMVGEGKGLSSKESATLRKVLRGKHHLDFTTKCGVQSERIYETVDHQPIIESEKLRVLELGGQVINNRVNGVLAVSRALGDHDQKRLKGLSVDPDVYSVKLSDLMNLAELEGAEENADGTGRELIICMASDGLWTYLSSDKVQQDIVEMLARGYTLRDATQVLMDKIIIDFRGIDNTTISLIRILPTRLHEVKDEITQKELQNRIKKGVSKLGRTGTLKSYGSVQAVSTVEKDTKESIPEKSTPKQDPVEEQTDNPAEKPEE